MKATLGILASLLLVSAVIAQAQQPKPQQANATTYAWHGELVSFDQGTRSVTIKTHVVTKDAGEQIKTFKAGDRVLLHWSGFDTTADGVRDIMKYDAAQTSKEPFLLPVELVTPTVQNDYITFKLRAPTSADAVLKSLKPGEWVTVNSRQNPASDAEAVVAIKPYVTANEKGTN